jgi:hypothetical protein
MNLLDIVPVIVFGAAALMAELLARASARPPQAVQSRRARPDAPRLDAHAPHAAARRGHPDPVAGLVPGPSRAAQPSPGARR